MKLFKRLLGISDTPPPSDATAWSRHDEVLRIDLARLPELRRPGSGVRLEGGGLTPRLLLFHGDDGRYHAVANRCTHMGRRIDVVAGSGTIQCCSLSKSTFSYDGQPVGGAANRPLQTYPVSLDGDTLLIHLGPVGK